jgi:hypothetical protein
VAVSGKDVARQVIDALPDDASLDDVMYAIYVRMKIERHLRDEEAGNLIDRGDVVRDLDAWLTSTGKGEPPPSDRTMEIEKDLDHETVTYHLEREGHITVLVPDRPVPPLNADVVNQLIEDMRREREDRWLFPSADE